MTAHKLIWCLRYAHRQWSRGGLEFSLAWDSANHLYADLRATNPVDAADEDMSYWADA